MGVLSIHKETGTLSVHRAVDYEEKKILKVRLIQENLIYTTYQGYTVCRIVTDYAFIGFHSKHLRYN